jgi:Protein of unknown function (DUF3592)
MFFTMKKTLIGLSMLLLGLFCIGFQGLQLYRIIATPLTGTTVVGEITGYKISSNGARKVENASSASRPFKGRSPWFEFKTTNNQTISTYSNAMQLFSFFNYDVGQKVTIAYDKSTPEKAVIINWREFPGIIFMILFGLLLVRVSKDFI